MTAPYGLMAKRAARLQRLLSAPAEDERAAAVSLAIAAGYSEDDLVDSDGNPLDTEGILRSLEVEQGDGDADTGDGEVDDQANASGESPDRGFDPQDKTIAEVTAYLDENPDQAEYVLDRERTGKARVTLIGA